MEPGEARKEMKRQITGKVLKLGDDVSSDVILPARYSMLTDPQELARHALEELASDMPAKLARSEIILAGRNFGVGTGREASASCLRHAGVKAIIAQSFARIFFRNGINHGIAMVQCPAAGQLAEVKDGDRVSIDLSTNKISAGGEELPFKPFPGLIMEILEAGGIVPYGKKIFAGAAKER